MQSRAIVQILPGPLPPLCQPLQADGAGALLLFEGIVRPMEGDAAILGLRYEVYRPMADHQLQRLAAEILEEHSLIAICAQHSEGVVSAGECSFRLQVASAHRAAGLQATEQFVDRMKLLVPIWKTAIYATPEVAAP